MSSSIEWTFEPFLFALATRFKTIERAYNLPLQYGPRASSGHIQSNTGGSADSSMFKHEILSIPTSGYPDVHDSIHSAPNL